jgi:hypothetical protein
MKTNEEKLKRLLQVAVENGWSSKRFEYFIQTVIDCDFYSFTLNEEEFNIVWSRFSKDFITNLDALIIHFEKGEVSFIEALSKAANLTSIDLKNRRGVIYSEFDAEICSYVREGWNLEPTSKRLDWLFQTFNHLLV